jgi:hypothetical protein
MQTRYLHQATYGNAGGVHTAKPYFAMKTTTGGGAGIFRTVYHPQGESSTAMYTVRNNQVYASAAHPNGPSVHALYTIQGNQMHATAASGAAVAGQHVFTLKSHP